MLVARFGDRAGGLERAVERDLATLEGELAPLDRSPSPMDRRVRIAAWFLSLVRVLRGAGESDETIRACCLDLAERVVRPASRLEAALKRVQGELAQTRLFAWGMRRATRKLRVLGAHPDGFDVSFVERDRDHAFGFDIHRCGIRALFARHGLEAYVPILCEVDHLTSAMAGLELVRTGTLATGADECDFRYHRV